jgi:hypothetical protein
MKRLLILAAFCLSSIFLHAQVVDTTTCDVLKNPAAFNGKTVRIKGTVVAGFDQFVIKDATCGQKLNAIWLSYPEGTKAKAGPAVVLRLQPARNFAGAVSSVDRAPVALDKNKDFKQFDSLLAAPFKGSGACIGCAKNEVMATLVGRLDGIAPLLNRDAKGTIVEIQGFGNLNAYGARLVLQSVSEVTAKEIDYSKSFAATKGEVAVEGDSGDPVAAAHKAAKAFGPDNAAGSLIERAAAAWGKPGEDNGVMLNFGVGGEYKASDENKSNKPSPDGVLYNCTFDMGRLKGSPLAIAIVFAGSQIADLREVKTAAKTDFYELQAQAWENAVRITAAKGLKTLTLPGGYLLWNSAWKPEDRDHLVIDAITGYLTNVEMIQK